MSKQGSEDSITACGLLYHGNFSEWKAQLLGEIRDLGITTAWSKETLAQVPEGSDADFESDSDVGSITCEERYEAMTLIRTSIHSTVLERAQIDEFAEPAALLAYLEAISGPFRITDLPPELRSMVYSHYLADWGQALTTAHGKDDGDGYIPFRATPGELGSRLPPLLHVSGSTRTEFIKMFYSRIEPRCSCFCVDGDPVRSFEDWIANVARTSARYLNRITLILGGYSPCYTLQLSFDEKGHLQGIVEPCCCCDHEEYLDLLLDETSVVEVEAFLHRFLDPLEKVRRSLELKGEALVMAATACSTLDVTLQELLHL